MRELSCSSYAQNVAAVLAAYSLHSPFAKARYSVRGSSVDQQQSVQQSKPAGQLIMQKSSPQGSAPKRHTPLALPGSCNPQGEHQSSTAP